jgi:hypothetical protein
MKRLIMAAALFGFSLGFWGELSAAGARVTGRAGLKNVAPHALSAAPAPVVQRNSRHHFPAAVGYPYYWHHYYPPYQYHRAPVIIVAPSYYYPYYHSYYSPTSVFLSAPFYCFTHHEGFATRIGFIDHVSGTHKIPINTVAAICPDGNQSCVIE